MSKRYKQLRRRRYKLSPERRPSTFIGAQHPHDGRRWECQCARCGSSMESELCGACGGEGFTEPGELYEQDPLWYDQDDTEACHKCNGEGGWMLCLSSEKWCQTHALPGRGKYPRHTPEWYAL